MYLNYHLFSVLRFNISGSTIFCCVGDPIIVHSTLHVSSDSDIPVPNETSFYEAVWMTEG